MRTIFVRLKNITMSAEPDLIAIARSEAQAHKTTLNQMFRDWLAEIAARRNRSLQSEVEAVFARNADTVNAGRKFSRDEMNER